MTFFTALINYTLGFLLPPSPSIKDLEKATYRIYSCISRPFTTKKSAQKIALDLYTSHTQRPDQAVREISKTTAWSASGKPVQIAVDFHQFLAHSLSTKNSGEALPSAVILPVNKDPHPLDAEIIDCTDDDEERDSGVDDDSDLEEEFVDRLIQKYL